MREKEAARSLPEKADEAVTLIQLARISKRRVANAYFNDKNTYEEYMSRAEKLYKRALALAKEFLG